MSELKEFIQKSTQTVVTEFDLDPLCTKVSDNFCPNEEEYSPVILLEKPAFDPLTQYVEKGSVVKVDNSWVRQWDILALSEEQIASNLAAKASQDLEIIADKESQLWCAADAYTTGQVSGVAIGILAIGVMQQKPKALAISAWSKSLWDEYYVRKSAITATSALDLDFSLFGEMPYSVPELTAEVGL